MKRLLFVFLLLFCIAGFGTGFAGANALDSDGIDAETMPVFSIKETPMPLTVEIITVYHPLSMLLTDTEADKLQAFTEMVWIPENDGAPAGFYYQKILFIPAVPDGLSSFSAF